MSYKGELYWNRIVNVMHVFEWAPKIPGVLLDDRFRRYNTAACDKLMKILRMNFFPVSLIYNLLE